MLMAWFIVGIEMMLAMNSITNVYSMTSTGQVIPFIVGLGTVTKLGFNALTEGVTVPPLIWGFLVSTYDR